jgi:hypothetical protein
MMHDSPREIMQGFALRTGVGQSGLPSIRYLWTDAFAVCNWLGLFVEEDDAEAMQLALQLVDETHRILGRHRPEGRRRGWISGLDEEEGARHPATGGLRIGKELPERASSDRFDAALEWDRDGQYFHYLTKWMYALDCVSRVTEDLQYRAWAAELARIAYARFSVCDAAGALIGLHWKMSIDLSRSLVPSMGQHDPLDGFLVYTRLQAAQRSGKQNDLSREIRGLSGICGGRNWFTDDALGIGGLLTDANALARMMAARSLNESVLLISLLESSLAGLEILVRSRFLEKSAELRLPFRELGLAIGLHAAQQLKTRFERDPGVFANGDELLSTLEALLAYARLAATVEQFWLQPVNRRSPSWTGHLEINEVMLATSLAPYGYLEI